MSSNSENSWSSNKEILEEIVFLESTSLPGEFKRDGINFWPAVRIRLAFGLIERRYKAHGSRRVLSDIVRNLFKSIFSLGNKLNKSNVLFVSHPNYQYVVNGQNYDRVLEGYKLECQEKGETYSELNLLTGEIKFEGEDDSAKNFWLHAFLIKVYVYIYIRIVQLGPSGIETSIGTINRYFKTKFPGHQVTGRQIGQYLAYLRVLTYFYGSILRKLGVSRVYQATYYDPVGLSINAAASRLGISTFCAQHGGQSQNNPAFGKWTNLPTEGYGMLPDVFLCWDEESANTIRDWADDNGNHTTQITGYHWPNLWRNGNVLYEKMDDTIALARGRFNIIFSMQPSIGMLPEIINDMLEHFSDDVNWWFRMHPRQSGSDVEATMQHLYGNTANIFISEASKRPLPALMAVMDLHITCFSSCVYEAIAFDVPTIFIHKAGQEYFNAHIQSSNAKACLAGNDLKNEIIQSIKAKDLAKITLN